MDVAYEYLANSVYEYVDMIPRTRLILDNNREFTDALKDMGYDGTIQSEYGDEAVAFYPNQIKSADPVTYDDGGNVIPLSQRFNEENEDIRHSVKKIVDENGNDYGMGVNLDSTLLSDLTESERIEMVKEYVKELGGKSFTAFDSNHNAIDIHIAEPKAKYRNKNGKKVLVNKDLVGYQKSIKQESIALVDELILTSKYTNKLPAAYPHGWLDNYGQNDWVYWTTYLQDKENTIWKATLNIATTANGEKILYDIVPIEKVEGSVTSDTTATNNNISQTEPIVNTNSENFSEILNSRKTVDPITSREELAKALSKVAKGEDRAIVESYKANVNLIKGETARLESLRKEIDEIKYKKSITYEGRELSVKEFEQLAYAKAYDMGIDAENVKFKALRDTGKYVATVDGKKLLEADKRFRSKDDIDKLATLEQNYQATIKRITTYDKKLLQIEAMSSIKQLINREKKASYDKAKAEGKEALKEYKAQAIAEQKKITERYQEMRKKNVEGRKTTEMRHKLMNTVHTLDQLLVNPTKKKHIPIGLQKPVAEALNILNTDTVGAEERLAKITAELKTTDDPVEIERLLERYNRIKAQGDKIKEKIDSLKAAYDKL